MLVGYLIKLIFHRQFYASLITLKAGAILYASRLLLRPEFQCNHDADTSALPVCKMIH